MYAYCNNNPAKYVDPSGRLIVIEDGATDEEIAQYERAIRYISGSKVGAALIEKLEESDTVFTIAFIYNDDMYYDPNTGIIYFDPYSGLVLLDGKSVQSAAVGLAHEMGHAAQYLDNELENIVDEQGLLDIENANIQKYETPIARQLGEPTRRSYYDCIGPRRMNNSTHFITIFRRPLRHPMKAGTENTDQIK